VHAAFEDRAMGLIDNWLRHIRDAHGKHEAALQAIAPARLASSCCGLFG